MSQQPSKQPSQQPHCANCPFIKKELRDTQAQLACFDMDHRCELDELREQLEQAKKQAEVKDQEIANMQSNVDRHAFKMQKNEELCANAKTELSELKARNEQLEQKNKQLQ